MDAAQALNLAKGSVPLPTPNPFTWTVTPQSLNLQPASSETINVQFNRSSAFTAPINLSVTSSNPNVIANVEPTAITGNSSTINVTASPSAQDSNADLTIQATTGTFKLETVVRVNVLPERTLSNALVIALKLKPDGLPNTTSSRTVKVTPSGSSGLAATIGSFTLPDLEPGRYVIVGVKDVNANRALDSGDYLSSYTTDGISTAVIGPPLEFTDFDLEVFSSAAPSLSSAWNLTAAQRDAVTEPRNLSLRFPGQTQP